MRIHKGFLVLISVFLLSSCGNNQSIYNFETRKDSTLISSDNLVILDYKTNNDGKLVELNIDRLLTIEEMVLLNPNIDFEYELDGFTGEIFTEPDNTCTDVSNDILVPINIEVGNTRYKFDNEECLYKTVDSHNAFKPGYAEEYLLTDTVPVASHVEISIIVYNPEGLINFIEIYTLPNTYKTIGVYNILINRDRDGFAYDLFNYSRDITIFEQLYLKHQEAEATLDVVSGVSTDINLLDINSLMDVQPLIDSFEEIYDLEITAILELQDEIGIGFEVATESIEDEPIE